MKKTDNLPFIALVVMTVFIISCIDHIDTPASGKTPPPAKGMGRVEICIAGSDARTLLPDTGGIAAMSLEYKLAITKAGEDTPAVNVTFSGNNWTGELEPGDYTVDITAVKSGTSQAAARGNENLTVNKDSVSSVNVALAVLEKGTGYFSYSINIQGNVTAVNGILRFVSLSGGIARSPVAVTGANLNGTINLDSGYYRVFLNMSGITGEQTKFFGTTSAAYIADTLTTKAVYNITGDDFIPEYYFPGISNSAQLNSALAEIETSFFGAFAIFVTGSFQAGPTALTAAGFENKTIKLRSESGNEITLNNNGSLFTVGAGVTLVLENITLKGRSANNAPLVKVNKNGRLVINNGGKITGNNYVTSVDTSGGAGVYMDGGAMEIAGGEISGNTLNTSTGSNIGGGGVYAVNDSAVLMSGGAIRGNRVTKSGSNASSAPVYGGGIIVGNNSSFEMIDGVIEGNIMEFLTQNSRSLAYGGGVAIFSTSVFYFKGGKIRNNTCKAAFTNSGGRYSPDFAAGGGIFNANRLVMTGGIISGNTCTSTTNPNTFFFTELDGAYGGGIYNYGNFFTKTGGIIYGNDVSGNDSDGIPLKNSAQNDSDGLGGGHAVFSGYSGGTYARRNNTSWEAGAMDSGISGSAGGWE